MMTDALLSYFHYSAIFLLFAFLTVEVMLLRNPLDAATVRLLVRVEKLDNVFVLPADAVVREGPNAYVFRQNSDTFERKPVQVLLQDRSRAVIANDGAVVPGVYIAQTGAVQINRMLKSASSTVPKGFHVHADGSLHKNEDEGK